MKINKFIVYIGVLMLLSCKTTSETKTEKLDAGKFVSESGIVYSLPKTNLTFLVEAVLTDVFPGPYHEYAEKYMGLTNVPHKRETSWQISNIEINKYNNMDPEQIYIVEPSGLLNIKIEKLLKNELIFPVNKEYQNEYANQFYGQNEQGNDIVFKDLSVSKYIGEEQVTYYKRVQRDSLFAKVPVTKTQSVYKSFENKAEEAANFIFLIREKRFELISGMADYYPDGKALEVALKELDRLENEYMDLFIGKKFTSTYTANFEFTPTDKDLHQPYILFRFNKDKGVVPSNDLSGRPIIVELEDLQQTKNLSGIFQETESEEESAYKNKFYYRIPNLIRVKMFDGSSLIASRKMNVDQFGEIIQIPEIFLMDEEKIIEFYKQED